MAPASARTPSMRSRSVPMPSIRAPMRIRHMARSAISGSRAALTSSVSPSARVAAISRFSVAPTETCGKMILRAAQAAARRPGVDVAAFQLDGGADLLQRP